MKLDAFCTITMLWKMAIRAFLLLTTALVFSPDEVKGLTTISETNHFAYGANIGWLEWRGDVENGAEIGEYVCSGYIWGANIGWIVLGIGTPANGIRYQNNSATDWGVNHDGTGKLRGYAYGANIGWIAFEEIGDPRVDLVTGKLSGYVWSANCGWISLSNAQPVVQTMCLRPGEDKDHDGMPDAWELEYTNSIAVFGVDTDTEGDGTKDLEEYLAGTNPLDADDVFRIVNIERIGSLIMLRWNSKSNRCYKLECKSTLLGGTEWSELSLGFENNLGWSTAAIPYGDWMGFFRVRAIRPLMP